MLKIEKVRLANYTKTHLLQGIDPGFLPSGAALIDPIMLSFICILRCFNRSILTPMARFVKSKKTLEANEMNNPR